LIKANLTKVSDAKPRVLASSATFERHEGPKIAGLPSLKCRLTNEVLAMRSVFSIVLFLVAACSSDSFEATQESAQGVPGVLSGWTKRLGPLQHGLNDVVWEGEAFIAVGSKGAILTSLDGIDWVARESGTEANLTAVAAHGMDIIAVGETVVLLSTDHGEHWVTKTGPADGSLEAVAVNTSQLVVSGPNLVVMISEDRGDMWQAIDWIHESWIGDTWLSDISYRDGLFVASADPNIFSPTDGWIFVSSDGVTWNESFHVSAGLNVVVKADDRFIVTGRGGAVLSSFDGLNWTELQTPVEGVEYLSAAWNGSKLLIAGGYPCWNFDQCGRPETPVPVGLVSTDGGTSWDAFNIDEYYQSRGLAFGNGRFVSVGNAAPNGSSGGAIYTAE
jgi:hypothetical protein